MNTKPTTCQGCPLYHHGKGFVADEPRDVSVGIMGFSPSLEDVQGKHLMGYDGRNKIYETVKPAPFIGSDGYALEKNCLPAAGLKRTDVSLHHLLKCHVSSPPNWDTLILAYHHCTEAHLTISDQVKTLVTIGEEPWKLLQGEDLKLHEWRGFLGPRLLERSGCQVYATENPRGLTKDGKMDPHAKFFTRLDWKKLRKVMTGEYPLPIPEQCIASPSTRTRFTELLEEALCQPEIMVDTEYIVSSQLMTHVGVAWRSSHGETTNTPNSSSLRVVGFQVEWVHGDATSVERAIFMKYWPQLCRKVKMGFWNAKADLPILEKNLGNIPDRIEDPMQAHAVLWPDMPHDFEFVASLYGRYPKLKHLSKTDMLSYHWGDCIDLVWIWESLKEEFKHEPKCEEKYRNQNLKLIPILLHREKEGIKVNQKRVNEAIPAYAQSSQDASGLAQAYCGFPINLGSTGQIAKFLSSSEGLKLRSMDQDSLAVARGKFIHFDAEEEERDGFSVGYVCERVRRGAHSLFETRVMYAKNEKIVNSYLGPLVGVDRVYPQINCHTQVTGRHSTTGPSLPTFPPGIRDVVMPDPGTVWIGWDWKAQEPRIQWGESGSKVLERAFTKGEDIHTSLVCDLYGWERPINLANPHTSEEDAEWRKKHDWKGDEDPRRVFAKQVRYEVNYDSTEKAYNAQQKAVRLGVAPAIAKVAAQTLLNGDPELRDWFRLLMREGERSRITRSWGGGRRVYYWADHVSKMPLNEMRNFPLQAGGTDLYNLTIVEICETVKGAKFVYGVHDSMYISVPVHLRDSSIDRIRDIATQPRLINGRWIPFPGSFKMVDDTGKVTKL